MSEADIKFEQIFSNSKQVDVLFRLLNERNHAISHTREVKFDEHKRFVETHPYRIWFLVKLNGEFIGSFYLTTENTLGINVAEKRINEVVSAIIDFVKINYEPLAAISSVRSGRFAISVPPSSKKLIECLNDMGSELAQLTYYLHY
jgi:hypothetical protein